MKISQPGVEGLISPAQVDHVSHEAAAKITAASSESAAETPGTCTALISQSTGVSKPSAATTLKAKESLCGATSFDAIDTVVEALNAAQRSGRFPSLKKITVAGGAPQPGGSRAVLTPP
jgi:hypothetical protein